MNTAGKMLN